MDIQSTLAPSPAPTAVKATPTDKPESQEVQTGKVTAPAFSSLLQGLQGEVMDASPSLELLAYPPAGGEEGVDLLALEGFASALGIEGLVGQTQRLDMANADMALQDGSFLLAQQNAGLTGAGLAGQGWGAQPHIATGQRVATVAAGVQSLSNAPLAPDMSAAPQAAAVLLAQAGEVVASTMQALSDGVQGEKSAEGRVALHGAWTLEDPQAPANPALQRLLGQVEQWAAASAGVQPKSTERAQGGISATMNAELLASGPGSGTRLTENAVTEARQAQNAAFESPPEAQVQDMRFWLQGKQQRAEVVLEKDGQPVRVQVMVRGNEAHVTFQSDQAQTRALLDSSLAHLREMLEQQGVQLAGVTVQADARGDQSSSAGQGARNPWEAAPVQHGQVVVPATDAPVARAPSALGVDLYA